MKSKKIKLFAAAAIIVVAVAVNFSVKANNGGNDVKLVDLASATNANAECKSSSFNNGGCGISGICFWGRPNPDCDSTLGE